MRNKFERKDNEFSFRDVRIEVPLRQTDGDIQQTDGQTDGQTDAWMSLELSDLD